jgi:hypothetical protein
MRQGPGMPFGGMGSGMMRPVPMRQMPGQFGGPPMRAMGQAPYPMNPMMGMGRPARQGGILARLLGKGKGTGLQPFGSAAGGAGRAAGGGLLKSLGNPGSIHSFLNNTQQVLKTAQSVGPMIQQYGPLVKNLPAMWKLYRGLKDLPDQEEEAGAEAESKAGDQPKPETQKKRRAAAKAADESRPPKRISQARAKPGESKPKLYI